MIGRAEAFRLIEKAVVAAVTKNREAGLTTSSHINGQTVVVAPNAAISANLKKLSRRKARR